jgi:hypothetical protein
MSFPICPPLAISRKEGLSPLRLRLLRDFVVRAAVVLEGFEIVTEAVTIAVPFRVRKEPTPGRAFPRGKLVQLGRRHAVFAGCEPENLDCLAARPVTALASGLWLAFLVAGRELVTLGLVLLRRLGLERAFARCIAATLEWKVAAALEDRALV